MRFSIRDLLWATVVVAMGLGWWMQHQAYGELDAKYRETDAKRLEAVGQARILWEKFDCAEDFISMLGRDDEPMIVKVMDRWRRMSPPDWPVFGEPLVEP